MRSSFFPGKLRLRRQAREWAKSYTFWTCADVQVVADIDSLTTDQSCMNRGTYNKVRGRVINPLDPLATLCLFDVVHLLH